MADVQKLIRDPRFQSLNFEERDALLSEVSLSFRDAPQEHRTQLLNEMKQQKWWQPKAVEPAVASRTTDITKSTLDTGLDTPTTSALIATPARKPQPAVEPTGKGKWQPVAEQPAGMAINARRAVMGVDPAPLSVDRVTGERIKNVTVPIPGMILAQAQQSIGGKIRQIGEDPITVMNQLNPIGAVTNAILKKRGVENPTFEGSAIAESGEEMAASGTKRQERLEKTYPVPEDSWASSIRSGLTSTGLQLPAVVSGVGVGMKVASLGPKAAGLISTAVSLIPMGEMTEGSTYQRLREKGFDPGSASTSAYLDKVIEVGTEALPTSRFLRTVSGKVKFGLKEIATQFIKYGGEEYIGESIATVTQKMNEKYMDAPNMTTAQRVQKVEDYLASPEVWQDLKETIKTTTVQNIAMGILGGAAKGATNLASKDNDILNPAPETPQVPPTVDEKAHAAATSPLNDLKQPSEAQINSGNYKHGDDIKIPGLPAIKIENPQGSIREGVDPEGTPWQTVLADHYGFLKGVEGRDKDRLDIFLKPGIDEQAPGDMVVAIDQIDPKTGKLDESKIMIGYSTPEEAEAAYLANYDETGPARIGAVTATTFPEFSTWLKSGDTKQAFAQDRFDKKGNLLQLQGGDVRGEETVTDAEGQRAENANDAEGQGLLGGIPETSVEDAVNAKAEVLRQMATVEPDSERAMQLEVMLDQYNKIIAGENTYQDFQPEALNDSQQRAQAEGIANATETEPQGAEPDRVVGQAEPEGSNLEQAEVGAEAVSDDVLQGVDGQESDGVSVLQSPDAVAEPTNETVEFQAILDSFEAHGYVTKGKGKKNFYTDSDFQKHVKVNYPSVSGESKRNILAALKAAIAGRKLTAGQEQVVNNFRYDMEGHRQRVQKEADSKAAFEQKVQEVQEETGVDASEFTSQEKEKLVADYEKWQATQADRPSGETVTEPSEQAAAPARYIHQLFGKEDDHSDALQSILDGTWDRGWFHKETPWNGNPSTPIVATVTEPNDAKMNENETAHRGAMPDDAVVYLDKFAFEADKGVPLSELKGMPVEDAFNRLKEAYAKSPATIFEKTPAGDQGKLFATRPTFGKGKQGKGVAEENPMETEMKERNAEKSQGGFGFNDTGGYADRPQPSRPTTATTQTFLELPEMVELAKAINLGKLPKLVKNIAKGVLGRFSYSKITKEAWITLRKDLFAGPLLTEESVKPKDKDAAWLTFQFNTTYNNPDADLLFRQNYNRKTGRWEFRAYHKDPNYVLKTLAHEIGHNVDYLPDEMVKGRGNIFGHIAALKNYMKQTLEMYPDAKGQPITKEDRERLRKDARLTTPKGEDIITTITREVPRYEEAGITPQMITAIWQDVNGREKYPELYLFIAKMSDAEKKAIVVQAMRGIVDARLNVLKGKRQVGVDIVTEEIITPAKQRPEAVKAQFEKLLREEILKRRLYELEVVMDELKAVSQAWKPFDPAKSAEYTRYRHSAPELYADAVSVLVNEPQLLKDKAPTFYKAFFYYMGKRPEFRDAYRALTKLSKDPDALQEERYRKEKEMNIRGEEEAERIRKDSIVHPKRAWDSIGKVLIDKNWDVLKEMPDTAEGRDAVNHLNEIPFLAGEVGDYARDIIDLRKKVEDAGMDIHDLSAYMLAKHIINNRDTIGNTQGKTAATEQAKLNWMKTKKFGPEKFAVLEQAAETYQENRDYLKQRMEESGIVTPEFMEIVDRNAHYSHVSVQKYMDSKYGEGTGSGAGWKRHAEGNLDDIRNVFIADTLQDISILRMAKINEAKRAITDVYDSLGKVQHAEMKFDKNLNMQRPVEPKDEKKALLTVMKEGKPVYYVVDKHVADIFLYKPVEAHAIVNAYSYISTWFRDILVSKNGPWMARNLYKDFKDTVKNNPEIAWWNPADRWRLLKAYREAFKEVKADEMGVPVGKWSLKNLRQQRERVHTRSPDLKEMYRKRMLSTDRAWSKADITFDDELLRLAHDIQYGQSEEFAIKQLQKAKDFYDYLEEMGQVSEKTTKLAGKKYLRMKGIKGGESLSEEQQDREIGARIRERVGTPNFTAGGEWKPVTNKIMRFSNVGVQGIRRAIASYKHDPVSYIFKTVETNILPKVLFGLAVAGVFGDEIKKIVEKIPSWDRRNNTVLPIPGFVMRYFRKIGVASKHSAAYLAVPQDYEGQVFGALAYDLAEGMANFIQGKPSGKNFGAVVKDLYQSNPFSLSSELKMIVNWALYSQSVNAYDPFRQANILTREQETYLKEQGPWNKKSLEGILMDSYANLGLGNIYKWSNREFPQEMTVAEKVLRTAPFNTIGTFIRITDAGHVEQLRSEIMGERTKKAIKSYEIGDRINEAVKEGKTTMSQRRTLYFELKKQRLVDPKTYTLGRFNSQFGRAVEQKKYGIKPTSKKESQILAQED